MKRNLSFLLVFVFIAAFWSACGSDPCDDILCLNNGTCLDGSCFCPIGFTGANCETAPDPCANVSCLNGGDCVDGTCNCVDGFTGANCETTPDPCENVTCLNGGICSDGTCFCQNGFTGVNCEIDLAICELLNCLNDGVCAQDQFGDFICECPDGFYGTRCELIECSVVDCPPNATCIEDGSGTCKCDSGYEFRANADGSVDCGTITRDKYLGIFAGESICTETGTTVYQSVITAHPSEIDKFLISNFGAYGVTVTAQIEDATRFTIPQQDISDIRFEGTTLGNISETTGTVAISYQIIIIPDNLGETCDMILERQ